MVSLYQAKDPLDNIRWVTTYITLHSKLTVNPCWENLADQVCKEGIVKEEAATTVNWLDKEQQATGTRCGLSEPQSNMS